VTEEEAKTKWCPHAVASHTDPRAQTGYARPELGLPADTFLHCCIGSACMAWRKTGAKFKDARTGRLSDRDMTGHGTWIDEGYCGLAGPVQ